VFEAPIPRRSVRDAAGSKTKTSVMFAAPLSLVAVKTRWLLVRCGGDRQLSASCDCSLRPVREGVTVLGFSLIMNMK